MEDTWVSRDLPVLDATVALLEEGMDLPEVVDIAERSGLAAGMWAVMSSRGMTEAFSRAVVS